MNRRKDGRELFEVFRETMQTPAHPEKPRPAPSQAPVSAAVRPAAGQPAASARPVAAPASPAEEAIHTIRLGDHRQIEVFLSNTWAYGLILFALIILSGAFVAGQRFAPTPEPAKQVIAPDEFVSEAERVAAVTRVNTPASLAAAAAQATAPGASTAAPQPLAAMPSMAAPSAPVTGGANFALCLITYSKGTDTAKADEVVKFMQSQGFADARLLYEKSTRKFIVAVGSFATTSDSGAKDAKVRVSALSYKGVSFKDAYFTALRNFQ